MSPRPIPDGPEPGVTRAPGSPLPIVLHIGAFKTGTSYVQNVLWGGRDVLAARGALFAGRIGWGDQIHAVRERLGMPATRARQEGAWDRLASQLADWAGTSAMISMEFLSLAQRPRIRLLADDLAPAEVHVVLTARDLTRVIPASWQERVKNGRTWTWREFTDGIQHAPKAQPGKGFWGQQDLASIARRWSDELGPDRVTIVTVPPSGADPAELLRRIGQAAGVDMSGLDPNPAWDNASLGAVETEALRRLNAAVGDQAQEPAWSMLVKRGLAREGMEVPTRPLRLTAEDMAWVGPLQQRMVSELVAGGWPVVGDLDDLAPTDPRVATQPIDDVDEAEVSEALVQVAAALGRRLAEQERKGMLPKPVRG